MLEEKNNDDNAPEISEEVPEVAPGDEVMKDSEEDVVPEEQHIEDGIDHYYDGINSFLNKGSEDIKEPEFEDQASADKFYHELNDISSDDKLSSDERASRCYKLYNKHMSNITKVKAKELSSQEEVKRKLENFNSLKDQYAKSNPNHIVEHELFDKHMQVLIKDNAYSKSNIYEFSQHLMESKNSPQIIAHFYRNPRDLKRVLKESKANMFVEISNLEKNVVAKATGKKDLKTKPIPRIKGSSTSETQKFDYNGFAEKYGLVNTNS